MTGLVLPRRPGKKSGSTRLRSGLVSRTRARPRPRPRTRNLPTRSPTGSTTRSGSAFPLCSPSSASWSVSFSLACLVLLPCCCRCRLLLLLLLLLLSSSSLLSVVVAKLASGSLERQGCLRFWNDCMGLRERLFERGTFLRYLHLDSTLHDYLQLCTRRGRGVDASKLRPASQLDHFTRCGRRCAQK